MRFERNGEAVSAAWAWHEAFNTGVSGIDIKAVLEQWGVQFTAKGGDNRIMDHVEKGIIQNAIEKLRHRNPVAWAWGMHAYAPDGTINASALRNTLFGYVLGKVSPDIKQGSGQLKCGKLIWIAIQDAKIEANSGKRFRRDWNEMSNLVGVTKQQYEDVWRYHFFAMKDMLKDLSGQALPPIANVIWAMIDSDFDLPKLFRIYESSY